MTAYDEGREARRDGAYCDDNPFDYDTEGYIDWEAGWLDEDLDSETFNDIDWDEEDEW